MARNPRQSYLPEPRAAKRLTITNVRLMRATLVAVLGSALVWVWWQRRLEAIWQHPQHAPLSAQWLNRNWADNASL